MLTIVRKFIEAKSLFPSGAKVLVAFSGGPDSVALLDVLQRLHYDCLAVHVNFHLRGAESDRDEAFARQFCSDRQIEILVEDLYAADYAEQQGVSIEMAARELRYERFESIRAARQLDCIAVGHHRDDSIETFFLNLLRGSSLRGLTGIRPKNAYIVRPLLCVDRKEIMQHLKEHSLNYITDSSNLSCDYKRNQIRLRVLPLLEEIQPSARKTIARSLHYLGEANALYEKELLAALQRLQLTATALPEMDGDMTPTENNTAATPSGMEFVVPSAEKNAVVAATAEKNAVVASVEKGFETAPIVLRISALEQESLPQSILYAWLSAYGFDFKTIENIWENRHASSGTIYETPGWRLLLDRDAWLLYPRKIPQSASRKASFVAGGDFYTIDETLSELFTPIHLKIERVSPQEVIPKTPHIASIDAAKLQFPLTLRHPHKGDSFVPFGMKGHKLLSDYFIDRKMSLYEKERCWLLCSGPDIVWIVGERTDDRFRVDATTREVLLLQTISDIANLCV